MWADWLLITMRVDWLIIILIDYWWIIVWVDWRYYRFFCALTDLLFIMTEWLFLLLIFMWVDWLLTGMSHICPHTHPHTQTQLQTHTYGDATVHPHTHTWTHLYRIYSPVHSTYVTTYLSLLSLADMLISHINSGRCLTWVPIQELCLPFCSHWVISEGGI